MNAHLGNGKLKHITILFGQTAKYRLEIQNIRMASAYKIVQDPLLFLLYSTSADSPIKMGL